MIYLLTAIVLTLVAVVQYTFAHKNTQNNTTKQNTQIGTYKYRHRLYTNTF